MLLKKIYVPSSKVYQHLHFKGIIDVFVGKNKSFKIKHVGLHIENELFWGGIENAWEKESLKLWIELSKISNTIIDVGAYSGIYSLVSATINSDAKIYAFEPMEHNYNLLSENIKLNNFKIEKVNKACSNFNGKATVYIRKDQTYVTSVTVNKSLLAPTTPQNSILIETVSLEDYILKHKLSNIDLIKIDVETHEAEVLEGLGSILDKYRPTLLIEVLNDEVGKSIQNIITDMEYLFFDVDENSGIKQVYEIKKSSYFNYLICQRHIAKYLNLLDE